MPAALPDAEPSPAVPGERRPAFAPDRAEGGALAVLAVATLTVLAVVSSPGVDPTPGRRAECRLNVNDASSAEWCLLRGVGPKLAGRILGDRQIRGSFHAPPDLLAVKGMGPKTYDRLAPHLRFPSDGVLAGAPAVGPALAAR